MKHAAVFAILFFGAIILSGCGGGGGGSAPSATTTTIPTPTAADGAFISGRPETATTAYTVAAVAAPTAAELTDLLAADQFFFSASARTAKATAGSCTPTNSASYSAFFTAVTALYNAYRTNVAWPTGVNGLAATFRTAKSQIDPSAFNLVECSEDYFDAQAGYHNVFVWDSLVRVLDEATDLLFYANTATEFDANLRLIVYYAGLGQHFVVITPAMHNALAAHATYGPESSLIFADALAFVVGHEFGHMAMAHSVQKIREMNNNGTDYASTPLSYGHEFQADIYATTLLKLGEEDTAVIDLVMYILELYTGGSFSTTHPAVAVRRAVVSDVAAGTITASILTPLYTYARAASRSQSDLWEGFNLRKSKL